MGPLTVRLEIAKIYFDLVKAKMGDHLIKAYVFGSVGKGLPGYLSDIDVLFAYKKPPLEEKYAMNSGDALWVPERQGVINLAHNAHYTSVYKYELEEKYGIEISVYEYYEIHGMEKTICLNDWVSCSVGKLIEQSLIYPDDFETMEIRKELFAKYNK